MIRKSKNLKMAFKKCDRYFSKYVRLKYADKNGYVKCYTCGRKFHWKKIDAGHFITRDAKNTRYDEENIRPQCSTCNRFKSGKTAEFALHLLKELGRKNFEALIFRGNQIKQWKVWEIDELSQKYSEKVKELSGRKL